RVERGGCAPALIMKLGGPLPLPPKPPSSRCARLPRSASPQTPLVALRVTLPLLPPNPHHRVALRFPRSPTPRGAPDTERYNSAHVLGQGGLDDLNPRQRQKREY